MVVDVAAGSHRRSNLLGCGFPPLAAAPAAMAMAMGMEAAGMGEVEVEGRGPPHTCPC